MAKSKNRAIWYLFTTMLSIFNICTIRIFDGFNWPFYAVTVNAVISLCGLIFHVHLNQRDQKRPLLIAVRILLLLNSICIICSNSCIHDVFFDYRYRFFKVQGNIVSLANC